MRAKKLSPKKVGYMSVSIPTPENLKEKAPVIRKFMKEKYDVDVSQGHSLELISKLFGFKDWNTANAVLKSKNDKFKQPVFIKTVGDLRSVLEPLKDSATITFWNTLIIEALLSSLKTFDVDEGALENEYSLIMGGATEEEINFQLKLEHQDLLSSSGKLIY